MSMLLAALMQLSSAVAGPTMRIEVDEDADRFRIVLTSDVTLQFDATAFDIAHTGLAPNSVGVLVRQGNGNVVGAHAGDTPSYSSELSSQSRSVVAIHTTEGVVAANSEWLVFDDFPTSGFGGRRAR